MLFFVITSLIFIALGCISYARFQILDKRLEFLTEEKVHQNIRDEQYFTNVKECIRLLKEVREMRLQPRTSESLSTQPMEYMPPDFIELTEHSTGAKLMLNVACIQTVKSFGEHRALTMLGAEKLLVRETYEEIAAFLSIDQTTRAQTIEMTMVDLGEDTHEEPRSSDEAF